MRECWWSTPSKRCSERLESEGLFFNTIKLRTVHREGNRSATLTHAAVVCSTDLTDKQFCLLGINVFTVTVGTFFLPPHVKNLMFL